MTDRLSRLSLPELGQLFPIKLVDYREEWRSLFDTERKRILELLGSDQIIRIEHYGSTAIPGILSKPTVDLLIHISKELTPERMKRILIERDYLFMEEQKDQLMCVRGYHEWGAEETCYHLHFVYESDSSLWDGLIFRDYLISHPDTAAEYVKLKRQLAERFRFDREAYTEGKGAFIRDVLSKAKVQKV